MTIEDFTQTLEREVPNPGTPPPLLALWYDARGDWERAHETVQNESGSLNAAVHAYLHRKEGDDWNARYWYNNARRKPFNGSLDEEWRALVQEILRNKRTF